MKKIFTLILGLILSLILVKPALAYQYGGVEVSKKISIDKVVRDPSRTTKGGEPVWVDNLFLADYRFGPNEGVEFKITITNTGNQDLDNVHFKDSLPEYLKYLSGDYDVTFNLKTGESRDFYLNAKVASQDQFAGSYCLVNLAEAWFNGQKDQDTTQVCIGKEGEPIQVLPEAGPTESLIILLGSTILAITGGVLIKKKS